LPQAKYILSKIRVEMFHTTNITITRITLSAIETSGNNNVFKTAIIESKKVNPGSIKPRRLYPFFDKNI